MGTSERCAGEHRFFVADVAIVESEGKVIPLIVCTACGQFASHEFQVAKPHATVTLLKEKEK